MRFSDIGACIRHHFNPKNDAAHIKHETRENYLASLACGAAKYTLRGGVLGTAAGVPAVILLGAVMGTEYSLSHLAVTGALGGANIGATVGAVCYTTR